MKKTTQRLLLLLVAVALALTACGKGGASSAIPDSGTTSTGITVDRTKAVIDTANVLSDQTEQYVTNLSIALQDSCGAQIGVYTVEYIGNTTMESYCYEIANAWALGDAEKDNGVVLLLATKEGNGGDYYLTRGLGLESQLTVATIQTLLDEQLEPAFALGDMDTGTRNLARALTQTLCEIYNVTIDIDSVVAQQPAAGTNTDTPAAGATPAPQPTTAKKGGSLMNPVSVAILIIVLIIVFAMIAPRGPRSGGYYRPRRRTPPPPPPYGSPRPPRAGAPRPPRPSAPSSPRPSAPRPSAAKRPTSSRPSAPRPSGGKLGGSRPGGTFKSGGGSFRGGGAGRR